MKHLAFVMALVAMTGCSKGDKAESSAVMSDTSNMMMMSDPSHTMTSDTSNMMMGAPKK
jgi:hypothetical protein